MCTYLMSDEGYERFLKWKKQLKKELIAAWDRIELECALECFFDIDVIDKNTIKHVKI